MERSVWKEKINGCFRLNSKKEKVLYHLLRLQTECMRLQQDDFIREAHMVFFISLVHPCRNMFLTVR